MDARKEPIKAEGAAKLLAGAETVHVASGKKTLTFAGPEADQETMIAKATGRTGNLRAPTLRQGNTFYVGFNEEIYSKF